MSRTVPTTGTDRQRLATVAAGLFLPTEVHTTNDQHRTFMGGTYLLGPNIYHGSVSDESAMLALKTSSQGCFPNDECYRIDTNSIWKCISNRGALLSDWINTSSITTINSVGTIDGGNMTEILPSSLYNIDGGAFTDTISPSIYDIEGGPFL